MNRTFTRITGAIAATVLSIAGLAACGSSSSSSDSEGQVYFLNFKPEAADQWKAIAKKYTKQTGVKVTIRTAASGTYESTLKSEMAKSNAPTLFQVNGPVGLATWKKYAADLSDTALYKQLTNKNLALKSGKTVAAVPYVMETYGIIYNKALLEKYIALDDAAVSSIDEINSFAKLKAVADGIQKHKSELGVEGAFTSAGFDSSSDWRFKTHLANLPLYYEMKARGITGQPKTVKGTYLKNYKNIFDLYITDSTTARTELSSKTADDATSEFATGKAVFYQNGTWAWSDLQSAGFSADNVGMMPIYIGVKGEKNQGLTTGSENYLCINSKASTADQKATAAFLKWMITSKAGKNALANKMGFTTPFKSMANETSDNPLVNIAKEDSTSGKTDVTWNFTIMPSETWKNDLGSALLEYAQGTGNWDAVKTAFVDNWATEYNASH